MFYFMIGSVIFFCRGGVLGICIVNENIGNNLNVDVFEVLKVFLLCMY